MTQNKVKKIGFFSALSICFSSVVGIGIFLKNASVGKNVEGNGISWLITWITAGLMALLLAYHFGKISQIESKKGLTGLTSWTDEIVDRKNNWFKTIVKTNYGIFYNPILTICITFFNTEFLISFFKQINPNINVNIWTYVVLSFLFLIFFVLNNFYSPKFSSSISLLTSVLKFVPLFVAIFVGIIFFNKHHLPYTSNGFENNLSFDKAIQGIMLSMPSVLFAFDSFIGVGTWSRDIKGGEKSVSRVIVVAMILVTIIYCLICLVSILHYNQFQGTTIINVLIDSLPKSSKKILTILISFFIFISAFGTSNSICGTCINEFKNLLIEQQIISTNFFYEKFGAKKGTLFFSFLVLGFWSIIIYGITIIMKSDAFIDGISNVVVIFIFLIYAYLILLFWKNKHFEERKLQNKPTTIYSFSIWATFIFVLLVVFLNFYFVFYDGIIYWNRMSNWGLLLTDEYLGMKNSTVLIFYLSFIGIYLAFPFINQKIVSWKNKDKIE